MQLNISTYVPPTPGRQAGHSTAIGTRLLQKINATNIGKYTYIATRIKNIKNVTGCRDGRSAKPIETR